MAQKVKYVIVVVNGYGCHLDTPLDQTYLPKVAKFIEEHLTILEVIYTGGFTQRRTAPGISEAKLMSDFVTQQVDFMGCEDFFRLEEDSYTTYENSQKVVAHLDAIMHEQSLTFRDIRIVHFCEATRAPLVVMLDRHFLLPFVETIDDITIEAASWERVDPFKQVHNLIYNKLAIKYPLLGLAERERKKRIRRAEQI